MAGANGKANGQGSPLDLEHELPTGSEEAPQAGGEPSSAESELARVKAERDALLDRVARLQAEFDNARKRQAREQQDYRDYALTNAISSLLPILDSFDRAIAAPDGPDFRKGVDLIHRQLHDVLSKLGVEPIIAERGQQFDPKIHEAIQTVDTDEVEHHAVVDQLQRGYRIKDRVLRPAMVRVAQNPNR